ncbi:hypothetical protein EXIGLDRAFT_615939, partial [Exidia glandulosa HHB12029]
MSATEVKGTPVQPSRPAVARRFFEGYIDVGGVRALTLIDTGTDTDMVSAGFAKVVGLKTFALEKPVGLQMACVGSRSRINFGARTGISIGKRLLVKDKYFDVVNLERYDVIMGLPFLWTAKAVLDFSGEGTLELYGVKFDLRDSEFAVPTVVRAIRDRIDYTASPAHVAHLIGPIPARLPPLREVNHSINFVEEKITYPVRRAKCPDALKPQLLAKIERYMDAGWWAPTVSQSAPPLLCIPK